MTYDNLIHVFGTATKAAKVIGVSVVAVTLWRDRGIPIDRQFQIELLTNGRLKAARTAAQKAYAAEIGDTAA